jgi:hypothetical protein
MRSLVLTPDRILSEPQGKCWCGAPLDLEAGVRFDDGKKWVWARCSRGHLLKERELPQNLGSRT